MGLYKDNGKENGNYHIVLREFRADRLMEAWDVIRVWGSNQLWTKKPYPDLSSVRTACFLAAWLQKVDGPDQNHTCTWLNPKHYEAPTDIPCRNRTSGPFWGLHDSPSAHRAKEDPKSVGPPETPSRS